MLEIQGKNYKTLSDAAEFFRVAPKTVLGWIERGIIPKPKKRTYGLREVNVFPDTYLDEARRCLEEYRRKRRQKTPKKTTDLRNED